MRKILTLVCLALCLAATGYAQQIRDIDETVVLRPDGSARVTQVWDVNVVSGTEFYLPFDHLGPMDITDLSVSEDGEVFVSEGDGWDTKRSREEKRGRCGIVRKAHGVELCWGQGDYGDHVWTVSYTVKGLVMQMGDYAGLYFTFVNPGLSAPPQHVKLTLINDTDGPAWTPDNVLVWGFRSDSEIYVEDGVVRAESKAPFDSDSAMTVLARFEPGLFTPAVTYGKSFEQVRLPRERLQGEADVQGNPADDLDGFPRLGRVPALSRRLVHPGSHLPLLEGFQLLCAGTQVQKEHLRPEEDPGLVP